MAWFLLLRVVEIAAALTLDLIVVVVVADAAAAQDALALSLAKNVRVKDAASVAAAYSRPQRLVRRLAAMDRRGKSCLCIRNRRTWQRVLAPVKSPLGLHVYAWPVRSDRLHGLGLCSRH